MVPWTTTWGTLTCQIPTGVGQNNHVGITFYERVPAYFIPRPHLVSTLIIKNMFGPSFLNNCLNRAAAGSDEGNAVPDAIEPKYFDWWDIRASFGCYGDCLIKVIVDAVDEQTRILRDVKDADIIMMHTSS